MNRVLLTATLSFALTSPAATAAPPVPSAVKAVGLARDLASAAELLDRLTEAKGRSEVRGDRTAVFEGLQLSARFLVPGVEVRDHIPNEVFGPEAPGRRVAVTVKVDCVVRCTINPRAIEITTDLDYPDTVVVTLPAVRVSADFAEGAEAEYEVEYGRLRSPALDGEKAAELRREMYAAARQKAADMFGEASLPAFRDELAREVEKLLRKQFPGKRIHVRNGR